MSDDQRLVHIEQEVNDLYKSQKSLEQTLNGLTITIALLEQTLRNIKVDQDRKLELNQRLSFFAVGGFISAVVTFIVRGGLV